MFSVDLLNMSAEMETGSTSTNGVYEVTMALKNDFAIKIKEIEHVFTQLADVTKSHDQTKQELRRTLCKACSGNSYVLLKMPLKTYSDFEGQTEHRLLQSGSIKDGKQHEPGKDDTPYQKKKQITPTEHVAKLELVVKELQDNYQKERKNVENLQASLETVQKEKDSYKRQVDNQQVEIVRLRQQTECVPESQHPAKTQSSEVASQEDKFNELVQDIGKGGDTAQNLVPGHQEHDQKIINSLRNENEGKSNKMGDYNKKCPGSTEDEEINRLKKENSTLQEDRSTRDVLIKSLRDEKDKQIGKNKQLTEEKQKLEQTVHELQTQLTDVNSKVNRKQGENQSLYDNQSTYRRNYNLRSRKEQEDKQTQHLEQMRQDKGLLEQNLDQHNEIVANLKADLEKKMKEIETLAKDKTDRDAELESLFTEKSNFRSQMELAKNEKAQIQREFDDQQEQRQKETSNIRDTENEIRKLTRNCDEQKRKLQCVEQEKKQLESQSAAIVQKRDLIQHEHDEVKQNLETTTSTIRGMQSEHQRLTDILGTSDERLRALKDNLQKLKAKMTTLQQEHDANKKTLDHKTLALKEMEKANARLKTALDQSSNKQSHLIDRLQQEKSILEQNIDQLSVQVGNLKAELKMKRTENELLLSKKVAIPELLDKQWRFEPRFDKEYLQSVQREIEHYWPLRDQGVTEDTLQHVNILFLGPVGAGKSSFINTVDSSLRGHVTVTAGAGNRDQSLTSAMRKYTMNASDNRRQLMFQLCDCRGLQDGVDITQDIESILEGHIPNNYVINPASPLKENMHGYNKHPGLEHKIHCVVYVLDAEKHSDHADIHTPFTTEDVRNQISNIQTHVDKKGIPQLILLNKVDIVCESTMQTTSDVYRSSLIRQRCIDAAEFLGLPPMTVLPMRNYYMETSTTDDIGILALYNTRQMLREADTFLRVNYLEELRATKYEPL